MEKGTLMEYTVHVTEVWYRSYEAASAEEAKAKAAEMDRSEPSEEAAFEYTQEPEEWWVFDENGDSPE